MAQAPEPPATSELPTPLSEPSPTIEHDGTGEDAPADGNRPPLVTNA